MLILIKFLVLVVTKQGHLGKNLVTKRRYLGTNGVTWNKPYHQTASSGTNLVTKTKNLRAGQVMSGQVRTWSGQVRSEQDRSGQDRSDHVRASQDRSE